MKNFQNSLSVCGCRADSVCSLNRSECLQRYRDKKQRRHFTHKVHPLHACALHTCHSRSVLSMLVTFEFGAVHSWRQRQVIVCYLHPCLHVCLTHSSRTGFFLRVLPHAHAFLAGFTRLCSDSTVSHIVSKGTAPIPY